VVREAVSFKAPPRTRGGKRGRVYYTTQVTYGLVLNPCKLLIVFIR
jgi:GTP-binding protein